MSVFKNIKDAKYQIELLKAKIPSIKNQQQLDHHIKLINTMISLLNNIDMLMKKQPDVETIDVLLLSKLHGYFMEVAASNEVLPIHYIVKRIDADINISKGLIKHQVIELLKSIELTQILKQVPVYKKNGLFKINKNKIGENSLKNIGKQIKGATSDAEFNEMIENLLNEFKESIRWN